MRASVEEKELDLIRIETERLTVGSYILTTSFALTQEPVPFKV